ncbi:hypothetical protein B5S33_g4737 [[Candida] boidinii]|nr:hypothetical protein B5S33_g4737 [[Candida] boidinii]GMG18553.1 unnamed protein product [[Candida] boidinii]
MTTATATATAERVAFAPISNSKMNIIKNQDNIKSFSLKSPNKFKLSNLADSNQITSNSNDSNNLNKKRSFEISTSTPTATRNLIFPDNLLNNNNASTNNPKNSLVSAHIFNSNMENHSTPAKRRLVTSSLISDYENENDVFTSPRLERARMLKLKLQLAYYKVQTNQTNTPLFDLKPVSTNKSNTQFDLTNEQTIDNDETQELIEEDTGIHEMHDDDEDDKVDRVFSNNIEASRRSITSPSATVFAKQRSNAISDLLAASSPIVSNRVSSMLITKPLPTNKTQNGFSNKQSNSSLSVSSSPSDNSSLDSSIIKRKSPALSSSSNSSSLMDNVVTKRATTANMKRLKLEFAEKSPELKNSKLMSLDEAATNGPRSASNTPKDSEFPKTASATQKPVETISAATTTTVAASESSAPSAPFVYKKPLISSLINPSCNSTSPSRFAMSNKYNSETQNATGYKLPPIPKFASQVPPIAQNKRVLKVADLKNPVVSPNTVSLNNIASHQKTNISSLINPPSFTTVNESDSTKQQIDPNSTILMNTTSLMMATPIKKGNQTFDGDETQIMSSPTRLLSTPSSIGAARCLLQLAHR